MRDINLHVAKKAFQTTPTLDKWKPLTYIRTRQNRMKPHVAFQPSKRQRTPQQNTETRNRLALTGHAAQCASQKARNFNSDLEEIEYFEQVTLLKYLRTLWTTSK